MNLKDAREKAYLDILKSHKFAKIETDLQDGEIVIVKVVASIKLNKEYLMENGYLQLCRIT